MNMLKTTTMLVLVFTAIRAYNQTPAVVTDICKMIEQKSFIKAKQFYEKERKHIPAAYQYYFSACLNNSFNKLQESENSINKLLKQKQPLPDTLMVALYEIRKDNAVKRYHYHEAAAAVGTLLNNYRQYLSPEKLKELQNDFKLWSSLENIPPQTILIKDNTILGIRGDKVGLKNLMVSNGIDSVSFVFDTGANISTIAKSVAKKMLMNIIASDIKITAITGKQVAAQLAVCKKLLIGNIELHNAVFLVFDDIDLSFQQIDYHINGILGFPVIEAMKEIQITEDGYFKVSRQKSSGHASANLALDGLIPLIFIGEDPFTFDTGADHSLFYRPYYLANQQSITNNYKPASINFGGAGGGRSVSGYQIAASFKIDGKQVHLPNVDVLTENVKNEKGIYGNIGQDVIRQFSSMTLNFDQMFIHFN
ncbi:retropepsin-like aspartic protease [Filimonas effusa]|uniref:Peptidase A2 domain-containing protein n=1 Tax=Filimonas effusa TaxID=2508721 RepID=A0A4Q1D7Q0_9BACT|nr:retropepsin-like aspartic protease [Filimonas effusa]RXK85324.1 hypothetical protein ESB13_00415 [Filimonas effusa]